jgi:hypothetical protein
MFYIIKAVSAVVVLLYATAGMCWFGVCWGHDTVVSDGNVYDWVRQLDTSPSTCHWKVEVYVSQVPHQGGTVLFGYIEVTCERHVPNMYRCIRT